MGKFKRITNPNKKDILYIIDMDGGTNGKPITKVIEFGDLNTPEDNIQVPTTIKTVSADNDSLILFDNNGNPYLITKANFLAGISASPSPSPTPTSNPEEEEDMPFKIISTNYQAVDRDRLFVSCGVGNDYVIITLPPNPIEGTQIEIQTESQTLCFIDLSGKKFQYSNTTVALSVEPGNGIYSPGLLIYCKRQPENQLTWLQASVSGAEFNTMLQSEYEDRKLNPF